MQVLVIGQGGREHALAWKLSQSPKVTRVYCAPGNAGTARDATNVDLDSNDIPRLIKFAQTEQIDLTVVGPEAPLVAGLVDEFQSAGAAGLRSVEGGGPARRQQGVRKTDHAAGQRTDRGVSGVHQCGRRHRPYRGAGR